MANHWGKCKKVTKLPYSALRAGVLRRQYELRIKGGHLPISPMEPQSRCLAIIIGPKAHGYWRSQFYQTHTQS